MRDLLAQVGDALGAAHRAGIVHRDIKPANLIVTPQQQVKVTDFGIARAADGVGITQTGAVMGTPQYLSPEQAEGKPATSASDVYALGVVAFECLAGRRPFDAESPVATALAHIRQPVPDLPPDVPADLASVVLRALSKSPAERYPDGAAFAAALRDPATAVLGTPRPVVPVPVPVPDDSRTQVLAATPYVPPRDPATTTTTTATTAGSRSVAPIVIAILLLVALAVVLTMLLTGNSDQTPGVTDTSTRSGSPRPTTPTESTSDVPTPTETTDLMVNVNPGDYIGRDFAQVEFDLRELGLRVQPNEQSNTNPDLDGQVTAVDPQGEVEPNTNILVTYYGAAPEVTTPPTETIPPTTPPTQPVPPTETVPPTDIPTS